MPKKVTKLRTIIIVVIVAVVVSDELYARCVIKLTKSSTINHKSNAFQILLLNGKNALSAKANDPNIISDSTSCRVMLLP